MNEFRDNPKKSVVRKEWCKPLLKFIHEKLGYKLIYLGLPGPQALDLLEWIDYIEQVIAFQCRDYPNPSSITQPNKRVFELEQQLISLERQGRLSTFSLYDGYIEEVVLRGRDTNGNSFGQNDVVTVYNLDFCNSITVPLDIKDDQGNISQCYKSDAIRKLLEFQRDILPKGKPKKFVMFLTVHTRFWQDEEVNFRTSIESQPLIQYFGRIDSLKGHKKRIRFLKAYVYHTVKGYFSNYDFTPEFMPVIIYKGSGNNWLSMFTIVGAVNKNPAGAPCFQRTEDFLKQKFLTVQNGQIEQLSEDGTQEIDCLADSVGAFSRSKCYTQLWNNI